MILTSPLVVRPVPALAQAPQQEGIQEPLRYKL